MGYEASGQLFNTNGTVRVALALRSSILDPRAVDFCDGSGYQHSDNPGASSSPPSLTQATMLSAHDICLELQSASIMRLDLGSAQFGNLTSLNATALYSTGGHRGQAGMTVRPDSCTAYFTQGGHSSIFSAPIDALQPVNTSYTYRNFRFNPAFALDTQRDRVFWWVLRAPCPASY